MNTDKSIKKMNEFIDRLFKRSNQPLKELEKIYNIHPAFFTYDGCIEYINNYLKLFGYELNPKIVSKLKGITYSFWHKEEDPKPTTGPGSHPVGCGYSGSSGTSHGGYGGSCSFGGGGGMCMSSDKTNENVKLLIKRKNPNKRIGDINIYGGIAY